MGTLVGVVVSLALGVLPTVSAAQQPDAELRLVTPEGHLHPIDDVRFSPDGRYVATVSWDRTTRLWAVATGQEVQQFSGHARLGNVLAFSPDGRFVLTGGTDVVERGSLTPRVAHFPPNNEGLAVICERCLGLAERASHGADSGERFSLGSAIA